MQTERELVRDIVSTVGQILSNYQAALLLLEEAVTSVPPERAIEVLREAAHEVFTPVRDACAGVTPGLEELVAESLDAVRPEPGQSLRDLVIAERSRVAATHSRLIRRQATFMAARPTDRNALAPAALRLDALETGSHSAGALFKLLFDRCRA